MKKTESSQARSDARQPFRLYSFLDPIEITLPRDGLVYIYGEQAFLFAQHLAVGIAEKGIAVTMDIPINQTFTEALYDYLRDHPETLRLSNTRLFETPVSIIQTEKDPEHAKLAWLWPIFYSLKFEIFTS